MVNSSITRQPRPRLRDLREAVRRDDNLSYTEPWAWMHPPRHALAALLLEQGHVAEAEEVYRDDLGLSGRVQRCTQHPDNVWALHGLVECLERCGETWSFPFAAEALGGPAEGGHADHVVVHVSHQYCRACRNMLRNGAGPAGPGTTPFASLPMYNFPEMRSGNAQFWGALRGLLLEAGLGDVPETLVFQRGPVPARAPGSWRCCSRRLAVTRSKQCLRARPCGSAHRSMTCLAARAPMHRAFFVVRADFPGARRLDDLPPPPSVPSE